MKLFEKVKTAFQSLSGGSNRHTGNLYKSIVRNKVLLCALVGFAVMALLIIAS